MTYHVWLHDHVLGTDHLWYNGSDPLKAMEKFLFLSEDEEDPTSSVTVETITTQQEEKRERWIKAHPVKDPEPLEFTPVEDDGLDF